MKNTAKKTEFKVVSLRSDWADGVNEEMLWEDVRYQVENWFEWEWVDWYSIHSLGDFRVYWDLHKLNDIQVDWLKLSVEIVEKLLNVKLYDDLWDFVITSDLHRSIMYPDVYVNWIGDWDQNDYQEGREEWIWEDNNWIRLDLDNLYNLLLDKLREMTRYVRKNWVNMFDYYEEESILQFGYNEWLFENKIETDYCLFDFEYTNKKSEVKSGMIQIADGWDTIFDWLWIKIWKIGKKKRTIEFYSITN